MNLSTLSIYALWCFAIGGNLLPAVLGIPLQCATQLPPAVLLVPIPFFSIAAWFAPRSPFFVPQLAKLINERLGANTYEAYMVRLKPVLMFGVSGLFGGLVLLLHCGSSVGLPMFSFSAGAAFLIAHFIMRFRQVPGV
jgi:hypothetical protein